jgi:hypothetical protein
MKLGRVTWSRIFLVKGVYNIAVSLVLLIWAKQLLPLMGMPAGNPAYPQMFLLLCAAFGVGYVIVGLNVDSNAGIAVMGIIGQLSVFVVSLCQWLAGAVYSLGLVAGIIDLVFALAFTVFLWTHDYPLDTNVSFASARRS